MMPGNLNDLLRAVAGRCCANPLFTPFTTGLRNRRVHIAHSHYFGPKRPYLRYQPGMPLRCLEESLALLTRSFQFCPLADLLVPRASLRNGKPLLAITFDDGFDLEREGVLAILDRYGIKTTFFVITSCIDNKTLMWRNKLMAILSARGMSRLTGAMTALHRQRMPDQGGQAIANPLDTAQRWPPGLKDELVDALWRTCAMPPLEAYLDEHRPYFSLQALHDLQRAGHEIGLHTRTHPMADTLSAEQVRAEFDAPLDWLRQEFHLDKVPVSYPFGCRLRVAEETRLFRTGKVSCLLGDSGFSPCGTEPWRLERTSIEGNAKYAVFARPLIATLRRS